MIFIFFIFFCIFQVLQWICISIINRKKNQQILDSIYSPKIKSPNNEFSKWHIHPRYLPVMAFYIQYNGQGLPTKNLLSGYQFLFLPFSKHSVSFLYNSSKGTSALVLLLIKFIKRIPSAMIWSSTTWATSQVSLLRFLVALLLSSLILQHFFQVLS